MSTAIRRLSLAALLIPALLATHAAEVVPCSTWQIQPPIFAPR